jgi:hypothetical protein
MNLLSLSLAADFQDSTENGRRKCRKRAVGKYFGFGHWNQPEGISSSSDGSHFCRQPPALCHQSLLNAQVSRLAVRFHPAFKGVLDWL